MFQFIILWLNDLLLQLLVDLILIHLLYLLVYDFNYFQIPHAAKKHVVPPPPPPLSNPLASSLPVNQTKEEEEEEEINVPGPKLRFSLFSYGEEDDDNDNKEDEKTEKEKEEDAAFDAFMADIAKL